MPGLSSALRRPYRHDLRRSSSAAADLDPVPLLHGPAAVEPADRPGTRSQRRRRAGDDRAVARRDHGGASAEVVEDVVECDEVYVTAGHKGQPAAVAKKVVR